MLYKTLYIGLICCLLGTGLLAQSAKERRYRGKKAPVLSVQEQVDMAQRAFGSDPKRGLSLLEGALLTAIKNGSPREQAECYLSLGQFNYSLGQGDLAVENGNKAYNKFIEVGSADGVYRATLLLAQAYQALVQYEKSLSYYRSYEQLAKNKGDNAGQVLAKSQIGEVLLLQGKGEEAQGYFEGGLAIENIAGNYKGQAAQNRNIGRAYQLRNEDEEALNYYNKSFEIAEDINDNDELLQSGEEIASVFRGQQRYDDELRLRNDLLEVSNLSGDTANATIQNLEIGNIYLERKQEEQAIPYFKNSINLSEASGSLTDNALATKSLSEAYRGIGSYSLALKAYQEYVSLVDSAYELKATEIKASQALGKELLGKQQRIDLLEKDKQLTEKTIALLQQQRAVREADLYRQKIVIWGLAIGMLLTVVLAYLMYRNTQQKKLANQLLALKSLRTQMNPHFIFNALNSVNSYIAKSDERAANKYLSDFSKLMRAVLENSKHDFVPLSSEVEVTGLYLALEHSRFADKFDYEYHVNPAIDATAVLIPPMLIQPYIENAVWHGLRYKQTKGHLKVAIDYAAGNDKLLRITVQDNGIGRQRSAQLKTKNQREGTATGMKNVKSRIQLLNDMRKVGLQVQVADLQPDHEDVGTLVTIILNANKG